MCKLKIHVIINGIIGERPNIFISHFKSHIFYRVFLREHSRILESSIIKMKYRSLLGSLSHLSSER